MSSGAKKLFKEAQKLSADETQKERLSAVSSSAKKYSRSGLGVRVIRRGAKVESGTNPEGKANRKRGRGGNAKCGSAVGANRGEQEDEKCGRDEVT